MSVAVIVLCCGFQSSSSFPLEKGERPQRPQRPFHMLSNHFSNLKTAGLCQQQKVKNYFRRDFKKFSNRMISPCKWLFIIDLRVNFIALLYSFFYKSYVLIKQNIIRICGLQQWIPRVLCWINIALWDSFSWNASVYASQYDRSPQRHRFEQRWNYLIIFSIKQKILKQTSLHWTPKLIFGCFLVCLVGFLLRNKYGYICMCTICAVA